jgi:hypothetical protein
MKRPVDIEAQFDKLCTGYGCHDTHDNEQMHSIVVFELSKEASRGSSGHWTYDLNRHQALIELRDALKAEISHA